MNAPTYKRLKKDSMLNNAKLLNLINSIKYVANNKIEGDVVECGVWMGGSAAIMACTLLECGDVRTLRLFDSFKDICEPLPVDGPHLIKQVGGIKHAQGRLQPVEGFYTKFGKRGPGNPKYVYKLLKDVVKYPKEKIKIYKGWFQHTLAPYSKRIPKISLLFLDCDLYMSTKFCLEYLCEKVVPGGMVIVDDYNGYAGCKVAVDTYLKNRKDKIEVLQVANTGCVYWLKG